MKPFLIIFFLLFTQALEAQKPEFIRVFNSEGKKIAKGRIFFATDSTVVLFSKNDTTELNVSEIYAIRTKRSAGHNILVGASIGAVVVAIPTAVTANPDDWFLGYTAGEGILIGTLMGAPAGAIVGGISTLFKKSAYLIIDGDYAQWSKFINALNIPEEK